MIAMQFRSRKITPSRRCRVVILALGLSLVSSHCSRAEEAAVDPFDFRGPIPTRDMEPLNTPFLAPIPEPATVLGRRQTRLDADLDIPNNYQVVNTGKVAYTTDFEEQRLSLGYARGLGGRQEASIRVPLIARDRGLFDSIIRGYDRLLHLSGNGRSTATDFQDVYNVTDAAGNSIVDEHSSRIGIGDTTLEYRRGLTHAADAPLSHERLAVSARGLLKLPTGSSSDLFGSGGTDFGLGLEASWRAGRRLAFHGNATEVKLGKPSDAALDARSSVLHAVGAGEYALGHRASLVVQIDSNPSPVRLGYDPADLARRCLTMGLWRQVNVRNQLFASFSENKLGPFGKSNNSNAPDFTLSLGFRSYR